MDTDTVDLLDRRLLHALRIDGRASWNRLGQVLGSSDRTVARRWARLRASGLARVVGATDPQVLAETQWHLRVRVAPGKVVAIGEALARRPDTSWVRIVSGGAEIVWAVRAHTAADADQLMLDTLPRSSVREVTAQSQIHVYAEGAARLLQQLAPLTDDELAALSPVAESSPLPPEPPPTPGPVTELDEVDRRLLAALQTDGRASVARLAAISGAAASTVRRRVDQLRRDGVLTLHVEIDPGALGRHVLTLLWIRTAPADLERTGMALADHPEIGFAAATTGRTSLYASVFTRDTAALYDYLTHRLAELPAVVDVESTSVLRSLKGEAGPRDPLPTRKRS
ncbi:Lrp/AsnC family transcriptional regulator [Spelaeicoccus albus]